LGNIGSGNIREFSKNIEFRIPDVEIKRKDNSQVRDEII